MIKVFLSIAVLLIATAGHAQHGYGYSAGANVNFVPNGFRSVVEENALMERVMAERRRQAAKEEGVPYVEPKQQHLQPSSAATPSAAKHKPAKRSR